MGREVKRVPLDFDYPLKKVWYGYQITFCHEEYKEGCERCREFARIMGIPMVEYACAPGEPCPEWKKYFKVDPPEGEGWQLWETTTEGGRSVRFSRRRKSWPNGARKTQLYLRTSRPQKKNGWKRFKAG